MPMNVAQAEIFKLMQKLSAKEKRAVRVFRICTHAYFTSNNATLLNYRWTTGPLSTTFFLVTGLIEDLNWPRWYEEAKKAGLR